MSVRCLNVSAGRDNAEPEPPMMQSVVALPVTLPDEIERSPLRVNVLPAPRDNAPAVSVNVPPTVNELASVMPFALLIVRLLRLPETAGSDAAAPEPPNTIFELAPPVNVPLVVVSAPFSVNVCAPMASAPEVSVRAPLNARSLPSVTPFVLFTVRVANAVTADGIAIVVPEPANVRLEVDWITRLPPELDSSPFSVKLFAPRSRLPLCSVRFTTVNAPPIVTPAARLMVMLLVPPEIVGRTDVAPDPPTAIVEEASQLTVPDVLTIAPFIVSVLPEISRVPAVHDAVPEIVRLFVRVVVDAPLFVKLFTVDGRALPVACATVVE